MRIRGLLVLVIGLFLAGGSVLVAHSYLQKMTSPPGEAQAKEVAAIVVARGEIPYGRPLNFEMVRLQEWPQEAIPPEAFTSLEEVLGTSDRAAPTVTIIRGGERSSQTVRGG